MVLWEQGLLLLKEQIETNHITNIRTLLKPGACLAVIEFKKIEGPPGPPVHIRMSEAGVEKIITPYGFEKQATLDIGRYNYLMTFQSER